MRYRKSRLIFSLSLIIASLFGVTPVHAIEPMTGLLNCSTVKAGMCVSSISFTSQDGKKSVASLTGRQNPWYQKYADESIINSQYQEYEVPNFMFGGKAANRFIAPITYFPIGNRDCYYTPCVEGKEYIQINVYPTWMNGQPDTQPLHFPWSDTDKICGSEAASNFCYPPVNFGSIIKFDFTLRLPTTFKATAINGRGLENFSYIRSPQINTIDGVDYQNVTFTFSNLPYTTFSFAGAKIDQEHGIMEIDQPDLVIWGSNSKIVNTFGSCKSLEGISVTSNSFWIDMPVWNPVTQEMKVGLHGAHFRSDGSLDLINFQATITSQMAQCLWGLDLSRKVGAVVSLDYADGNKPIIQTISSKFENNSYKIVANGLHLSSPTLSLKLEEQKESDPISTNVQAKKPLVKVSSILCIKGKVSKKISGITPRCPTGYKVKK